MFIRAKLNSSKKSKYIQVVKSYRDKDGKSKQAVIKHIGSALIDDDDKINTLKQIGNQLIDKIKSLTTEELLKFQSDNLNLKHPWEYPIHGKLFALNPHDKSSNAYTEEIKRVNIGFHDIIGPIFDKIGFNSLFKDVDKKEEKFNLLLRNIVICRIANPTSKRALTFFMKKHFNIDIDLSCIYRFMDLIDTKVIKKIQQKAYENAILHSDNGITIGFYDVTTLYFESFIEDDLKKNGFSKDGKFNQPQVLFGLLSTKEGLPISYRIFEGNKFEGHTLQIIIEEIEKEFKLQPITIVADAGMLNKENLDYIELKGHKYIVGGKIKSTPVEIQKKILDKKRYKKLDRGSSITYTKVISAKQTIIVTHSPKRSRKDAYEREKTIESLKKKLEKSSRTKTLLPQRGFNKYLDIESAGEIELNEKKIYESSLWDGLHGIRTNLSSKEMSIKEILHNYKNLWKVEESFRITKHDLSIRPIFHWTPRRIESHIAMVFISFTCMRTLMYMLEKQQNSMSCKKIVEILQEIEGSITEDKKTGKKYYLPSQISSEAKSLYKIFNKRPKSKMMLLKM